MKKNSTKMKKTKTMYSKTTKDLVNINNKTMITTKIVMMNLRLNTVYVEIERDKRLEEKIILLLKEVI